MSFRPCRRLDNANVSYSFQDWHSFHFVFVFFFEIFDYALWFVYVVLAGTFIYSVLCSSFWNLYSFLLRIQFNRDSSQVWRKACWFLIFFIFSILISFLSFFHFALAFSSYPGPEICVRSSSELEFESFKLILIGIVIYMIVFVDLVAWLFVGFFDFDGSWAYINIWVPYSRLRCVLAHVHSLCSSHDWGKCLLLFFSLLLGA